MTTTKTKAEYQTYHPSFLPFYWRRYWKFGTGCFGDMACHHLDLPKWALGLGMPTSVETDGSPVHATGCPSWVTSRFLFDRPGGGEPIRVTWYDGGKRPPQFADSNFPKWGDGNLFVGTKGMLLADYGRHKLVPEDRFKDFKATPSIPKSIGHHKEWCEAIKGNGEPTCRWEYSGPLAIAVLLGTVSYRVGQKLEWDAEKNWVKNSNPKVEGLLKKEYRTGWSL